jgi:hypothetical protein
MTNDKENPLVKLKIFGNVEKVASITKKYIRLAGTADQVIKAETDIIPEEKYPFKITEVTTEHGEFIRYTLAELKQSKKKGYRLSVENIKKDKGRYSDTVYLKTTSNFKPELEIQVFGDIK